MSRPPKLLERLWYARLAATGFDDIENTELSDRPLREWHSHHFVKDEVRARREGWEAYFERAAGLLHSEHFNEICQLLATRCNARFSAEIAKRVWEMHCEGATEQDIGDSVGFTQTRVNKLLGRMRRWMDLV